MKIYNTETKTKEEFVPVDPNHVTMYVCGPTVYNHSHVGNFRPPVVFDTLARVLRKKFPKVTYARNITDIDDKINTAAAAEGVDISVISERFTAAYHQDLATLGVLETDLEPKVTDHISEITEMISSLIASGHAYEAEAHVLFNVASYDAYGELSRRDPEELLAGARVDVAAYKKDPGDFVLWKPSHADQPGWDSPWGRGRPGWHIECSAMIKTHLGETIDIHGGGIDLVFPHHENERAQSVCAHPGKPYVKYWVHNGFVNFNQQKMSKSLGNVWLVKDLLEQVPGEAIRYVLLSAHYRAPVDLGEDILTQAKSSLDRLYGVLRDMDKVSVHLDDDNISTKFWDALNDDLNTPKALAELFAIAKQANAAEEDDERIRLKSQLIQSAELLGLLQQDPHAWFKRASDTDEDSEIDLLVADRVKAKEQKDFARADEIREALLAKGVILEDGAEGTRWRRK